jgi:pyruvate/2-oxoglutarate dehydrogenase complex dihydrolipoamide dehydrogenase (E3) component
MSDHLGGNIVPGSVLPFKQDVKDYLSYLLCQANKAPARIRLNTEATKEMLDAEGYDALIIAVGSRPIIPPFPGMDKPHVHWAPEADSGKVKVGKRTVIVGAGAVGIESAIGLKRAGKDVTVIEMAPDMSNLRVSAGGVSTELMALIEELDIPVHLNCRLEEISDKGVTCRNTKTSEKVEFPADTVLLALGMSARLNVADSLRRCAPETEVFIVGDAAEVGNIATAVRSAFKAAAYI